MSGHFYYGKQLLQTPEVSTYEWSKHGRVTSRVSFGWIPGKTDRSSEMRANRDVSPTRFNTMARYAGSIHVRTIDRQLCNPVRGEQSLDWSAGRVSQLDLMMTRMLNVAAARWSTPCTA